MNPGTNTPVSCRNLVIVDPSFDEYATLADTIGGQQVCITWTNSGAGALRLAPSHCDATWMVNAELPDMSGLKLSEMLRAIEPNLTVQLVANHFDVEQELKAYRLGTNLYRTKPLDNQVLDDW